MESHTTTAFPDSQTWLGSFTQQPHHDTLPMEHQHVFPSVPTQGCEARAVSSWNVGHDIVYSSDCQASSQFGCYDSTFHDHAAIQAFPDCPIVSSQPQHLDMLAQQQPQRPIQEFSGGVAHLHDWAFPNYPHVSSALPSLSPKVCGRATRNDQLNHAHGYGMTSYQASMWNVDAPGIDLGQYSPETVGSDSSTIHEPIIAANQMNQGYFVDETHFQREQRSMFPFHNGFATQAMKIEQPSYQVDGFLQYPMSASLNGPTHTSQYQQAPIPQAYYRHPPQPQQRPMPAILPVLENSNTVSFTAMVGGEAKQPKEQDKFVFGYATSSNRTPKQEPRGQKAQPIGLEIVKELSQHSPTTHPHECEQCGKRYKHKCNLITHRKIHSASAPTCSYCGKRFTNKKDLIRHERTHTGVKPYSCDVCGKRFNDQANRRKHMGLHTGMKKYSCAFCNKQFCYRSSVKRHIGASEPCQRLFNASRYSSEKDAVIPVKTKN